MKNTLVIFIILLSSLLFITPTIAGEGHSHDGGHSHGPVAGDKAAEMAAVRLNKLANAGKIPASWKGIKASSTVKKQYAKGPEWVITFNNSKVQDVKKQKLYMFFTLDGIYIAANYSGN